MQVSARATHLSVILSAVLISFVPGLFVRAEVGDGVRGRGEDSVVRRDRAAYRNLDIEKRFGVSFRAHERVCTDAKDGEAHCNARIVTDDAGVPAVTDDARGVRPSRGGGNNAVTIPSGFGPAQLRSAYSVTGVAAAGKPPVIAIVDAYDDPNAQADLNVYSSKYGIPSLPACKGPIASSNTACFQKVSQTGSTSRFPRANQGWALEISLDVQVAHAMCQNCSILLVEANSASFADLMAAEDRAVALGATVVSNSFGAPEFSGETAYDSHFNKPGVAFTVSAGDSGYGVEYPAASRYVTAVGGTSLFLNPDGTYNNEIVWSGTGSGCSAFETKQSWQLDAGCVNRVVADVAAVADPNTGAAVYDSYGYSGKRGWFQVGGTSLAAPVVAGVYALSGNTTGAANSIPYSNLSALHDVTSGSNGSCGGIYLCTAWNGYDGPTGLGTPNGVAAF